MVIRCWGTRGSIPVSGKEYLKYGGDTTCLEIKTNNDEKVIIDAGTGIRKLGNQIMIKERNPLHLLLTHSHYDHLIGFPFFQPIYNHKTQIHIYGSHTDHTSIRQILSNTMSPPYFPIKLEDIKAELNYHRIDQEAFKIQSLQVTPISLSHPNTGFGYKFFGDGKSFVFLTDNELRYQHPDGLMYEDYLDFSRNADLLIHDSEFNEEEYRTTKTWGHSTYKDALKLALEANVKQFGLCHHNQDRTDAAMDDILLECKRIINDQQSDLNCFALQSEMEIQI